MFLISKHPCATKGCCAIRASASQQPYDPHHLLSQRRDPICSSRWKNSVNWRQALSSSRSWTALPLAERLTSTLKFTLQTCGLRSHAHAASGKRTRECHRTSSQLVRDVRHRIRAILCSESQSDHTDGYASPFGETRRLASVQIGIV